MSAKHTPFSLLVICLLLLIQGFQSANADSSQIDFRQLKQYALLARAAYLSEDEVRQPGFLPGYSVTQYRNIPEVEITYLIATEDKSGESVIAVRGTSNVENALVDIAVKLKDDTRTGIKLHEGFALGAKRIYQDSQSVLDKSKKIHLTGHSLGGAVAVILAMYLDQDGYDVGNVITFGQPKVTNVAGANKFAHLNLIRVVTPRDLVPLMPPLDPMDIKNLDIYWHAGREVLLNTDNTYSVLQGTTSMLRATKFTQQMLDEQNLHNHKMDLYLQLIDSMISQSKQVPYETDFNLFNLFGQ